MKLQRGQAKKIAYVALGTAFMVICSWLYIPLPVPITMQTFALCLLSSLMGMKTGLCILGCYIALGAVGLPVFSGFLGGIGTLLGATGGYIMGFVFIPLCIGLPTGKKRGMKLALSMLLGLVLCYISGSLWYTLVYAESGGFWAAMTVCVLPYLIPDGLKLLLALVLTERLESLVGRGWY